MEWHRRIGRLLPFALRVEGHRLLRAFEDWPGRHRLAEDKGRAGDFSFELARGSSPLERVSGALPRRLQQGKERNIALALRALDGVLLRPGRVFSYHHLVGRPSRLRGFRPGLELRLGQESEGAGGGLCQVSNMLYQMAIQANLRIVERHRHGLDLFPDKARSVPFGCGATVFYNYRDLRFENKLDQPVLICLRLVDGVLSGRVLCERDPGFRVKIVERDHRFFVEAGLRMRENRIWRIVEYPDGRGGEELLAHNRCRVLY